MHGVKLLVVNVCYYCCFVVIVGMDVTKLYYLMSKKMVVVRNANPFV